MKKNLVIMLMMVLCAGFASAQTVSTVRGFVPGGSTGAMNNDTYATYATFAQPFATMVNNNGHEVTVGLAQMQLVTDSITDVVTCGQGYHKHGFDLTEEELQELLVQCENEGQRGYLRSQKPNVAVQDYYYDSLVVIDLYVCPCTTTVENEEYEVIALNGECWFKENMRNNFAGSMVYTSELNSVDPADPEQLKTFGRLYTYEATIRGAEVCEDGEIQGICPEKWHLPTVDEVDPLFALPAENLRVDGHWIVDGNNNMTEFSAQPAGYYNSISQRFEGMLTETDFWMVDCDNLNPENGQLPVFQLIYSCNTPLRPNRPKEDAISVRCVYNIVKMLEDCEPDQNPNTNPVPPTPQYTCPSVSFEPSDAVSELHGNIASYGEIQSTITSVVFDGVAWGNFGARDSVKNQVINDITPDGDFVWQYTNGNLTTEVMSLTGNILITFDNGQVCSTPVSREQEVVNDCPTITINPAGFEKVEGKITPYSPNDHYTIVITGTYQGVFQEESTSGDLIEEEVVDINDDGTFTWYPNSNYDIDEFTSITGKFTITGPVEGCSQMIDFTTAQDCNLSVGPLSFVDGVAQVEITNFDPDYFEDIQIEYNGDQSYHPTSDDFENVDGSANTILSHQLPSGANSVVARFELKHEYYACGEDDEYYIFRNLCPTVSEFDVTADGVSVHVNNYDPNEIKLDYWEYQIIYNDNNPNEWIEDQNVQPQVNNGVATFTSSIPSLPTMDNVQAIRVSVRFIFSSSECYPLGEDAYDISTTVYSQQ